MAAAGGKRSVSDCPSMSPHQERSASRFEDQPIQPPRDGRSADHAVLAGRDLGTTWGPHALYAGRRPARQLLARTASVPGLTSRDVYSYVLGVRGRRFESCRPDQYGAR